MTYPRSTQPVVDFIRKHIPRPLDPPEPNDFGSLRWGDCCALGLHPKLKMRLLGAATASIVAEQLGLGQCVTARFTRWFDSQQDPEAVMNILWPLKKNGKEEDKAG